MSGMFGPVMSPSSRPTLAPGLRESDGEVDAHRALADAALARGDRDDVLDAGHELLCLARLGTTDHRAPRDVDALYADRGKGGLDVRLDLVLERAGRRRQLDRERDARTVDGDILDHVEGHDVAPELGLLDVAQRVEDRALGDRRHRSWDPSASHRVRRRRSDGRRVDIVPRRPSGRSRRFPRVRCRGRVTWTSASTATAEPGGAGTQARRRWETRPMPPTKFDGDRAPSVRYSRGGACNPSK
jgi:hypothetical protein